MIDKTYLYQSLLKLFCFLISLLVPAALLLGGLTRSISPTYPHQVYQFLPADEQGLTQAERLDLALITLAYLQHPEPAATAVRFLESQRLPGTNQPLYNERELAHLVDVKQLTDRLNLWSENLNWLLGLSLLALFAWPPTRLQAVKTLQNGAALSYFLLLAFLSLITFFWPLFFYAFHHGFFPPGSWSFAGTDTLIRLFPEAFWVNYAEEIVTQQFLIIAPLLLGATVLRLVIEPKPARQEPIGQQPVEQEPVEQEPEPAAPPTDPWALPIQHIIYYSDMEALGTSGEDSEDCNGRDPDEWSIANG